MSTITRVQREVVEIRSEFIEAYVNGRINHRRGDVTNDQVEDWENEAARRFGSRYPALTELLS